jgi:hypothetical protein
LKDFLLNEQDADEITNAIEHLTLTVFRVFKSREIKEQYDDYEGNEKKEKIEEPNYDEIDF